MLAAVNMFSAGAFTSDTCLTITATLRTGQTITDWEQLLELPHPSALLFKQLGPEVSDFNEARAGPAFPSWSSWSLIKQTLMPPTLGIQEQHGAQKNLTLLRGGAKM